MPSRNASFHDAVFQGVKADHHHASTWLQNSWRCIEQRPQIVQFAVYEDSKSLKGPGRWMNLSVVLVFPDSLAGPRLI